MAKLSIIAGATSQSVTIFIQNSSVTTGAGLTGLVYNSSSLITYYAFTGANGGSNVISLATLAAANSAFSSGGFKEIDATNMPGCYRLDIPNAAIAASKGRSSVIILSGATNMAPCVLEIELTAIDNQSTGFGLVNASANTVQWNGTNVSSPATAGIPDINVKNMNNVAATSITTINANQGTTQPLNFTGTAGSALVKSDMVDVAGAAVSATTAQLGVNVVNWNNTVVATPATAGIPDVNTKNINNTAAATPGASGGVLISGSNSGTTTLAALTCTGSLTISDGLLISRSSSNTSAITATGNGTGSGIVATSGSGATGDGLKAVAASTNGNGVTFTKTGTGKDLNATTTPLTLAKTTNITGFNDIAASAIVSDGTAITTSGGAVSTVTTVTNLTNAATAGDLTATMKTSVTTAATAATPTAAAVTARVTANTDQFAGQTITAAAGVTLPSSVASPTNITAGTITTATNLTNAPTAGDFTAAMKISLNNSTPASITGAVGSVTAGVTVTTNNDKTAYALTNGAYAAVMTQQLTESYAAKGTVPTPAQIMLEMRALLAENNVATTTVTTKKIDGSTSAHTYTLNDATNPTAITTAS